VDDPQEEDSEVEAVLHGPCGSDVGEPHERLLGCDVHPHERGDDAEGDEREDAATDAGESSPSQGAVGPLVDLRVGGQKVGTDVMRLRSPWFVGGRARRGCRAR
jgi:hypothetical protein